MPSFETIADTRALHDREWTDALFAGHAWATGLWGYYFLEEGTETNQRLDATDRLHPLVSQNSPHPAHTTGLFGPDANTLTPAHLLKTDKLAAFDSLSDSWTFFTWLYLTSPNDGSNVLLWGEGTPNQIQLRQFWADSRLTFKIQLGYYGGDYDDQVFALEWTQDNPTLNAWYFVACNFSGRTRTYPDGAVIPGPLVLRVNDTTVQIPTLSMDDGNPPVHDLEEDYFTVGPFAGKIATPGIYIGRSLSTGDLDALYNGGAGFLLPFDNPGPPPDLGNLMDPESGSDFVDPETGETFIPK